MLNKLLTFLRRYDMVHPGDTVVCAVSGGADSIAMVFAFYLLKEKLGISVEAAHYNHHLRGEESDRDEAFVSDFCQRYDIPVHLGGGIVTPGKKGLEAAARDARYAFLRSLSGKIATAHTADDNCETLLMHLVRGTGLKGLGGIAPVGENLIRPMLAVTRADVEAFLETYCLGHITDSSNFSDAFLRNRIRRHVMPLLMEENPRLAENLSQTALRLRDEETFLASQSEFEVLPDVDVLRAMPSAQRSRAIAHFLKQSGVREPEEAHIGLAESLVFSEKPSARGAFPGGITIARNYNRLQVLQATCRLSRQELPCPGTVVFGNYIISCRDATEIVNTRNTFTVVPSGTLWVDSRQPGDSITLSGGTKSLKKCLIDRKIPAALRQTIPVLRDDAGILGVCTLGVNQSRRAAALPAVTVSFEIAGQDPICTPC